MGGRVSDIAIDPHNPFVFYVGLGHGGVFKTNDNGVTFEPIFDKQPMLSIGAVAVAPSDSDVIWVGTGEANDRNSSDWGDGVYRSTDGGEKWQNVGLKNSRTIARIVVDPKKPDVAYVAAMGNLWADGGERGLFKTTDAGKTWKLVLKADCSARCAHWMWRRDHRSNQRGDSLRCALCATTHTVEFHFRPQRDWW